MVKSQPQSLVGYVSRDNVLTGIVSSSDNILSGILQDRNSLIGDVHIGDIVNLDFDYYSGQYVIIPSTERQTLNTMKKILTDYVTVRAVPYVESDNEAGGTTITIG